MGHPPPTPVMAFLSLISVTVLGSLTMFQAGTKQFCLLTAQPFLSIAVVVATSLASGVEHRNSQNNTGRVILTPPGGPLVGALPHLRVWESSAQVSIQKASAPGKSPELAVTRHCSCPSVGGAGHMAT